MRQDLSRTTSTPPGKTRLMRLARTCLLGLVLPLHALAQPTVHEIEPNDTPAQFQRIEGDLRLIAALPPNDQDGYLWTVSDEDATRPWTLTLQGVPGALTLLEVMRLSYGEDGSTVTGRERLLRLGSRDGSRPVETGAMVFEPGEYLLGVARAGGGSGFRPPLESVAFDSELTTDPALTSGPDSPDQDATDQGYRLTISAGDAFSPSSQAKDNSSREQARPLSPGRTLSNYAGGPQSWFATTLKADQAGQRWDLSAQLPVGRQGKLELIEEGSGNRLAETDTDAYGRMRLPALQLAQGRYLIRIKHPADGLVNVALLPAGVPVSGEEAEPNDKLALANRVPLQMGVPLSGAFQRRGDEDFFLFALAPEHSAHRLALQISTAADVKYTACLTDHDGARLQCRQAQGPLRLPALALEPGEYGVHLSRGQADQVYQLEWVDDGERKADEESEPNDTVPQASTVPSRLRIKGALHAEDQDFLRFDLSGEAQLWRFQVSGDGIHELAYHDGAGQRTQVVRAKPGQKRVMLDNLYLLPGTHHIAISGREQGSYTLLARPQGPPNPDSEREPNDDLTRMLPLAIGQTRSGTLPDPADRDNYRFHLANHDHVAVQITPPPDGSIRALLDWNGKRIGEAVSDQAGAALTFGGVLPPGDYRLELLARAASEAEYQLSLQWQPRFGCSSDCEPNHNPAFANPVPADQILTGQVGEWRDDDWFVVPVFDRPTHVNLSGTGPGIALIGEDSDRDAFEHDRSTHTATALLAAGQLHYLRIRGKGTYHYTLDYGDPAHSSTAPTAMAPPGLSMSLAFPTREVAAYQRLGQQLEGELQVSNPGADPVQLDLLAASSDRRWQLALDPPTLQLAAGATSHSTVRLSVPADAWTHPPVRISVAASQHGHIVAQTHSDLRATTDAALVAATPYWRIPESLRGGLNLAWRALGAQLIEQPGNKSLENAVQLHDGMAVKAEGFFLRGNPPAGANTVTIALAGDVAQPVAGFALTPFGRASSSEALRRFEIALSTNGSDFDTVVSDALQPVADEQYFSLHAPQDARFVRLTLIDNFSGGSNGGIHLGEFKVIAPPQAPTPTERRINLADPALGGHVVRAQPLLSQRWDDAILDEESADTRVRADADAPIEWVIGFHHNRAARITDIEWVAAPATSKVSVLEQVAVSVSLDSPLGPWTPVTTWSLQQEGTSQLALKTPVWARFVRFSAQTGATRSTVLMPSAIRIFEQPPSADYRSALGEWGEESDRASHEWQHPPAVPAPFVAAEHDSPATAQLLRPGESVDGQVWLERQAHWFKVGVPAPHNSMTLVHGGDPTLRTRLHAQNASGDRLPLRVIERRPDQQRVEISVPAGETVFIRVEEPPRSVVFSWDTSASVGAYLPIIYSALSRYAQDLKPGRDAANLMPFGAGLLLQSWHGHPYLMQNTLNEYPRKESSSAAERTLAEASEALAGRDGSKAIVLITDAATSRHPPVWSRFAAAHPRIIAVALDSHGAFGRAPAREQDLMQDWARVHHGHYEPVRSEGEMERAFERAAALLRAPAPYTLALEATNQLTQSPGQLQLVAAPGQGGQPSGIAYGLILDASGSMLQRLEGIRRIEIARRGLIDAVTRHIPPGTPTALRVFGHKQANACRTDLEIPLKPLDPASARRSIESIQARNLARTPIAESLKKMESDLARAKGKRLIVLVTDGEETCDGDPEAVIRALADKGFDIRLNIIGFALDDPSLEQRFAEWAQLGGGDYFSAADADSFDHALAAALSQGYQVLDAGGVEVARGVVGQAPVSVPAGQYQIRVDGGRPAAIESVNITPEQLTTVEIQPR